VGFHLVGTDQDHNSFRETEENVRMELGEARGHAGFYVDLLGAACRLLGGGSLPRVFMSYTSTDGTRVPDEVQELLGSFPGLDVFRDRSRIPAGDNIRDRIEDEVPRSLFLPVLTTGYVRRRWTLWEAGLAREHCRPMAVVDALKDDLRRYPPELANAPVLRWPPPRGVRRRERLLAFVLSELLRHLVHRARVGMLEEASGATGVSSAVLPPGPSRPSGGTLVYADPPLTARQLRYQGRGADVRYVTAAQFAAMGGWPDGHAPDTGSRFQVGLSVSAPPEARAVGLWDVQLHDLTGRLARTLMGACPSWRIQLLTPPFRRASGG